ncbi:MAG TPA: HupE/UreJ family protein [Limnobacter sp.]|uniref:HupE/UreJ family protein n=1 Tax=Limnobacter sp. TaxID=2003368 RepID=UPI002ED8BEC0
MVGLLRRLMFGLPLLLACAPVYAHEMGTAALIIHELGPGQAQVVFKRSKSADGTVPPMEFSLSPNCALADVVTTWEEDREVIQRARLICDGPLRTHTLQASGFTRLAPDLIVSGQLLDGQSLTGVLTPKKPTMPLGPSKASEGPLLDYLLIGLEHILFGMDHVLFVAGLYLLWRKRQQSLPQLLGLFTTFTVGHSLTLAMLVLGWIVVPTRAIEAWIALSVLWVAVQLALHNPKQVQQGMARSQLLVVLMFGLLHGSGFALSMEDRGFPADQLMSALLLFNLGIELGQLLIVTAMAALFALFTHISNRHDARLMPWGEQAIIILTGGFALFWTVERIATYA